MISHSFAVMSYNDSPYLSECLESLKNQTTQSKIYVATSTPSNYINDIAIKYGIEVFVTTSGNGITHDWNFSLHQAKTKYITLAHQDDIYLPDYTEQCLKAAEKFTNTLICFTGYEEIVDGKYRYDTSLLRIKRFMIGFFMPFKKNLNSKFWKKVFLSFGSAIPCPSVMYNLERLNGFTFSKEYTINLDWDAWLRMSDMDGRFVYIPKLLLSHRIHNDSATTTGLNTNTRQNEDRKMFLRIWPEFLARILAKFYTRSYSSNKVNG